MAQYLTPGVYLRPKPQIQRDLRLVRTDVAGFVGYAERGPLPRPGVALSQDEQALEAKLLPQRIGSWKEYRAIFGGFVPNGHLAYAVKAFFENGGQTAYVVRAAATDASPQLRPRAASWLLATSGTTALLAEDASLGGTSIKLVNAAAVAAGQLLSIASAGITEQLMVVALEDETVFLSRPLAANHVAAQAQLNVYSQGVLITARSAGSWGNRLRLTIAPLELSADGSMVTTFSLRVTLEPGADTSAPREEEFYSRLSLAAGPFDIAERVNSVSNLVRVVVPAGIQLPRQSRAFARPVQYLEGGQDGLSAIQLRDVAGDSTTLRGLRLLEEVEDIGILCAPDAVFDYQPAVPPPPPKQDPCGPPPPQEEPRVTIGDTTAQPRYIDPVLIYERMIAQCERLRDRVAIIETPRAMRGAALLQSWRSQFNTRFAALYYPWLKVPDALNALGGTRPIPPAGHVAGVYARIDNAYGVHRPPANAELAFVDATVEDVDADAQEHLNPYDINVIRSFPGRGIRMWGARALAAPADDAWRYIHVRRLMSMLEKSVDRSMQWAVFELNDFALRRTLQHALRVFLESIWRAGGLQGERPEQAFFVRCDETNNPQAVIDAGQVVCQVGVAVAAPMEFLVFEIRQGGAQSEIAQG